MAVASGGKIPIKLAKRLAGVRAPLDGPIGSWIVPLCTSLEPNVIQTSFMKAVSKFSTDFLHRRDNAYNPDDQSSRIQKLGTESSPKSHCIGTEKSHNDAYPSPEVFSTQKAVTASQNRVANGHTVLAFPHGKRLAVTADPPR